MNKTLTKIPTETWVPATWDEYLEICENPDYEKAKCYYHNGKVRIEMSPVGSDHARDHAIIIIAMGLYAALKGMPINGKDNCTYRKAGYQDSQPDVSYYIGKNAEVIPWGTSIINLDIYPPPDLVIEVAHNSLADDKGEKRLLYETLNVSEYWIVDVQNVQIIAFAVADQGSRRIRISQVFPGLEISILEAALLRSRQMNQSQVVSWLLTEFNS
jgi:Uma2 family endonuclease